ncbi:IS701 family transposase [Fischerella sp. PCC 9605]|uniref:IS701 family transposase n=1 Tax=Fischerella sp. PCC 9605 TaxID=1173024 RepID=UPI0018CC5DCF|nr:IS701 family transposase [Fischerella sp. PCC 9605]
MQLLETAPEVNLTTKDIKKLAVQLQEYVAIYYPFFRRFEQRHWAEQYLQGLLLDIPRKSIEPIMLQLYGAPANAVRAMQQFLGEGKWEDTAIRKQHWHEVNITLGEADGVFIFDGSDFPKQGQNSVGVKRQYCGELGKRANCQAGVFLGYASRLGYTLLDSRLYMPIEWLEDEAYATRRKRCGVPQDLKFATKLDLAREMLRTIVNSGQIQGQWVRCDEDYGKDPAFLDAIDELNLYYLADVLPQTQVWLERPLVEVPEYGGRGQPPKRKKLAQADPKAQTIQEIVEQLQPFHWSTHIIKEGANGPMMATFAALRVINRRNKLPDCEVWLLVRRHVETGVLKLYLSNAPADTAIEILVRISGMRWPIETCFEQGKQLLGMGDYEVRSWRGWHHHMTLVMLAHHFLVRMQCRLKKTLLLTLPQTQVLLCWVLTLPPLSVEQLLALLEYRQQRNWAAYRSHRKRRLQKLKDPSQVSL